MGTSTRRVTSLKFILLATSFATTSLIAAPGDDEFGQFQQSLQNDTKNGATSLQQEFSASLKEDERLLKLEEKEYEDYKKEIEKQWGEFRGSTKKEWVDYAHNNSSRSIVNFEKGDVTLEVIVPVDPKQQTVKKLSKAQRLTALNNLKKQLKKIINDKSIGGESPIRNQISLDNGKPLTHTNVDHVAKNLIDKKLTVSDAPFVAKDGNSRVKVAVKFKMVPNHLKIRADKFANPVKKYSHKYNVEPALVLAIIHTESFFNPKARSHIPAYGLMQLVPRSGGRDAYRHAFGKDKKPSSAYLYDPTKNIQLGAAYLDLLSNREFKKVNNKTSKMYLIVAAYNTGGGNVSRAIHGNTNIYKASSKINNMSPESLYRRLEQKLPHKETRDYIRKVRERKKIYESY